MAQQSQAPAPASTPPAASTTPATNAPATDAQDSQQPLTPVQQRDQQIRQFDPLDRTDEEDKESRAREKAARDAEKRRQQAETPTPGSIAATERDRTRPNRGPQVVSDDDAANEPVQEYTGPAVLSRSYSVSRPLIPQQLKWTESLGVNGVYDSGVSRVVNPNGSLGTESLNGTQVNWSLSGRHYFRYDQIAVSYEGSYSQYFGANSFSGANNSLSVDYSHVLTRRLTLNISGAGSILSQNYALDNGTVGADNNIANINLASSPNVQITDYGTKQFSTQIDVVWQKSARLSFDGGGSYFAVERNAPGLLGMTGQQARGDINYRLTRKMTVGTYYSFSYYLYPHGFGTTDVNTFGGIFSYAFTGTLQVRVRGGISKIDSLGLQQVFIQPALAALLGQTTGLVDAAAHRGTSDASAQIVKDFRGGRTATIAFAQGVSPGNGIFQTSTQQSISANFAMPLFRRYQVQASFGRDTLNAVAESPGLGSYASDYGRLSLARTFPRGVSLNFSAEFRHFDVAETFIVENQLRVTTGMSWGPPGGKLWPF